MATFGQVTVEQVAREVVAATDTDAGWLLAARWVAQRYRQLVSRTRFRHLRTYNELIIPAGITTGTVSCGRGSRTITADSTASTLWNTTHIGWHIQVQVNWYEIVEVQPSPTAATVTLLSPYAEDPPTGSGLAYTLVQRWIPLTQPDNQVRWVGPFIHPRRRRSPIQQLSIYELDQIAPSRPRVGQQGPDYVCEAPALPDGTPRYELYPYCESSELIWYVAWKVPTNLDALDPIPSAIEPNVLREGALIDLYRFQMARAASAGNIDGAAFWRNEMNAQQTKWERNILEAVRTDRGENDSTFILRRSGTAPRSFDIVTAFDEILSRWPR